MILQKMKKNKKMKNKGKKIAVMTHTKSQVLIRLSILKIQTKTMKWLAVSNLVNHNSKR